MRAVRPRRAAGHPVGLRTPLREPSRGALQLPVSDTADAAAAAVPLIVPFPPIRWRNAPVGRNWTCRSSPYASTELLKKHGRRPIVENPLTAE